MKNSTKKTLLYCFFLLISIKVAAAGPAEGTNPLDPNSISSTNQDVQASPINSQIILMLLLGILIGFYMIKKQTQKKALKG